MSVSVGFMLFSPTSLLTPRREKRKTSFACKVTFFFNEQDRQQRRREREEEEETGQHQDSLLHFSNIIIMQLSVFIFMTCYESLLCFFSSFMSSLLSWGGVWSWSCFSLSPLVSSLQVWRGEGIERIAKRWIDVARGCRWKAVFFLVRIKRGGLEEKDWVSTDIAYTGSRIQNCLRTDNLFKRSQPLVSNQSVTLVSLVKIMKVNESRGNRCFPQFS